MDREWSHCQGSGGVVEGFEKEFNVRSARTFCSGCHDVVVLIVPCGVMDCKIEGSANFS